jgi:flagellar hook-associated protein 2
VGEFASLQSIGITFDDKGKLSLDATKLNAALAKNPEALKELFTDEIRGVAAKLKKAIDRLAGEDNSLLSTRAEFLADRIESQNERIEFMDARLERERERLLLQFTRLESTIASMRENLSALQSLQVIPPLTSTSSSSLRG